MVISRNEISVENEPRIKKERRGEEDILFSIGSFQTFFPFVPRSWRLREYRKPAGPLPKWHHPLPSILLFPDWYFHSRGFGFFPAVSRRRGRKLWKFIAGTDFFFTVNFALFRRGDWPTPADTIRYDTEARLIKRSLSLFFFFFFSFFSLFGW